MALQALDQGTLVLPHVSELLGKYRELRAVLAGLEGKSLAELIDILVPPSEEECNALREVALLSVSEVNDIGRLFDRIKTHVTQPEMPEEGDFVRIMSLHKSKGLTSKVVIVAGCTQGLIPFQDDEQVPVEQDAILQEQRRLFYVAITRCTEILVLSSVARMERQLAWKIGAQLLPGRSSVGTTNTSQFIGELGPSAPTPKSGETWAAEGYP